MLPEPDGRNIDGGIPQFLDARLTVEQRAEALIIWQNEHGRNRSKSPVAAYAPDEDVVRYVEQSRDRLRDRERREQRAGGDGGGANGGDRDQGDATGPLLNQ